MAEKLHKLGIFTYRDLLYLFPRKYFDYTEVTAIGEIEDTRYKIQDTNNFQYSNSKTANGELQTADDAITIKGKILGIANKTTRRRNFKVTEAVVEDETGSIKVVWFNQSFLVKMLPAGTEVILNGKVRYDHFSHMMVMESPQRSKSAKIVPIYPETQGMGSAYIRRLIDKLKVKIDNIDEYIPDELIKRYQLLNIQKAVTALHFPKDNSDILAGRKRMAFDELFFISLQANLSKEELKNEQAPAINIDEGNLKEFTAGLPFVLTKDQKIAAWKIIQEIAEQKPMNRLLNGDVGSGKTVVAAFAAYVSVLAGFKVALMAPTEILAVQHFETFSEILKTFNIQIGLYTASEKLKTKSAKRKIKVENSKIENAPDIYIGTQALLHMKDPIDNLGLVIIDEQHRFGVQQRAQLLQVTRDKKSQRDPSASGQDTNKLQNQKSKEPGSYQLKANSLKMRPHFLSMTATPIPRTLQLALFGDLDVSIIKTMPAGRQPIKTRLVDDSQREASYQFIREQVKAGRQAFVICPLIEETKESQRSKIEGENIAMDLFDTDRKTVAEEYEKLSKNIFPDLKIGMLHGKMKPKDKNEIMRQFSSAELDILVSTSVVEVGVDIPNASIMMIEDADRFGLAQLHQFRGRVGRAEHQSFCLLFMNSRSRKAQDRLRSFENTLDGFKLAQIDLETRGPGTIFGTMQSGDFNLKMASFSDIATITEASEAAKEIVAKSHDLNVYPKLKEKLSDYIGSKHFE